NSTKFDSMLLKVANDDVLSFKNNNKWLSNHPMTTILFSDTKNTWNQTQLIAISTPSAKEVVVTQLSQIW
ncbi:MAG: nucleotidyl transferase AbiEii/AbiGii toxin family protein, partial [Candidatus Marinimicrobia bacterium]|nr:nucleotidyl transferase AbiEii/AbiGii toxin family protein [Candidatus Neomarinimicrobiota bacterium]